MTTEDWRALWFHVVIALLCVYVLDVPRAHKTKNMTDSISVKPKLYVN